MVEGQKMSKSLGNYFTLRDIAARGYAPEAIRYLLASVPYRKQLNFTFKELKSAAAAIERLRNFKLRLDTEKFEGGLNEQIAARTAGAAEDFTAGLNEDLNTAQALAAVFDYVRDANSAMNAGEFRAANAAAALDLLARFDAIFDVLAPTTQTNAILDSEVDSLIAERAAAKKARNFARADQIREQLLEQGIVLEDTKSGVRWKRK
jgi:cysteinyl-tRNA synthetase